MGVELRPLGVKCNIQCQYCYQEPQREAGNETRAYDIEKMKTALLAYGEAFTLFGGEPLMLPKADLETLWAWGLEQFGYNSVQTNGTLINDNHVHMFKEYRVHVGISIDGPGELNDVRWAGTASRTRASTNKVHRAIERLCRENIPPSIIATLHRCNASTEKLPLMHDWVRYLESLGVTSMRLHILEVDSEKVNEKYALTTEENLQAFLSFAQLEQELKTLKFDVFEDMRNLLRAQDNSVTCIWNACDPYTTSAVQGIEGNGQRSNCGRTNKDGIDFVKSSHAGFERYLALYHTPQAWGGCGECRFFLMCKGQCPGTAIDGDWRNRTEHCAVWMGLLEHFEKRMIEVGETPLSVDSDRGKIEQVMLKTWADGRTLSLAAALAKLKQTVGGDRTQGSRDQHGDSHGDAHGDHTDTGAIQ